LKIPDKTKKPMLFNYIGHIDHHPKVLLQWNFQRL